MGEQAVLAYENTAVMLPLVHALQAECSAGEFVIYRQAFRWKRFNGDFHGGELLPNCYEMFSLREVSEQAGLIVCYDFKHAAIVSKKLEAPHD